MAKVFLAVGHGVSTDGTWDSGCVDGSYTEADLMFAIAGVAVRILREHGVDVVTDWDTGNDRNMTYTVRDANASGVDRYISLHCDYNQAPSGTLPIVYPGSTGGYSFAQNVDSEYRATTGLGTRGILQRDDYEVSYTDATACIFETGSIRADIGVLTNAELCGAGIAKGILRDLGIAYNGTTPSQPSNPSQPSTPSTSASNPRGFTSVYSSSYYLSYGDGPSEDIKQFQRDCNFCGYRGETGNVLDVDGLYGSECKYACECIQRFHGLSVDGEFGVNTDIALMNEIAEIQEALKRAGYDVAIDGAYGPVTEEAIRHFQRDNGLTEDGICGSETRAKLGIE